MLTNIFVSDCCMVIMIIGNSLIGLCLVEPINNKIQNCCKRYKGHSLLFGL